MVLQLTVWKKSDGSGRPVEYFVSQEHITIGRGEANDVTLPGTSTAAWKKHVVARHAENTWTLVNCGDEDQPLMNGDRMSAQQSQEIRDGDMLTIGPYRIRFQHLEVSDVYANTEEETDRGNPFERPVGRLVSALEALTAAYENAAPDRRAEALTGTLPAADELSGMPESVRSAVNALIGSSREGGEGFDHESEVNPLMSAENERRVLKTVTDALAAVLQVPYQFRHKFIGHSLSHPADARFLYEGDGASLRSTLMDSSLSRDEREKRFRYVEEAADSLVCHQIAVVEGYKASVIEGVEELLARINPAEHRDDLLDENEVYGYVPALAQPAVLKRVREECRDLIQEDWSVAEQRIFRPAFRKAYLSRMTSPHGAKEKNEQRQ